MSSTFTCIHPCLLKRNLEQTKPMTFTLCGKPHLQTPTPTSQNTNLHPNATHEELPTTKRQHW